jgi:AcrR family transcriptional regulator
MPKKGSKRPDPKRAEKALMIRQAAYDCFSQRGYHDTAVDEICTAAGMSKGSFYWYFDTKQDVLLGILDSWAAEVEASMTQHFKAALTRKDRRSAVAEGLTLQHKKLKRLMPLWLDFLAQAQREPAIREGLNQFHRRIRSATQTLLASLVPGVFSDVELEALGTVVVGGFMGLMGLDAVDPESASFEQKITVFMQLLGHTSVDTQGSAK